MCSSIHPMGLRAFGIQLHSGGAASQMHCEVVRQCSWQVHLNCFASQCTYRCAWSPRIRVIEVEDVAEDYQQFSPWSIGASSR